MAIASLRFENEAGYYRSAIKNSMLIAVAIIFLTLVTVYSVPGSYPFICITAVPLLMLQIFTSRNYFNYIKSDLTSYSLKNQIKSSEINFPFVFAAGLAVKEGFLIIFLCFDIIWLSGGYIIPGTAQSFSEYVARLGIGPISGEAFLIFTVFFWLIYIVLYFIGSYVKDETADEIFSEVKKNLRVDFTLKVTNFRNETFNICGFRIPDNSGQPIILFPGFFQNGFFYDLDPHNNSIAEYLWKAGYDVWIFHPRGTAASGFSKVSNSMDDYAGEDIPSIIDFVLLNTGKKPILIGHSQGGISSLMSLMGTSRNSKGEVFLSVEESIKRQDKLKGLVTLGSYLNFSFSKPSSLQKFIRDGLIIKLFGKKIRVFSSVFLLNLLRILNRVPVPVPFSLRIALLNNKMLRIILFPLTLLLNIFSLLGVWEFLYRINNVSRKSRIHLFYKTIDATFWGILAQFHNTIMFEKMLSHDKKINYSDNYSMIKLPVSIVTMEFDTLADPLETKKVMFANLGSAEKHFTEWKDQGHEDFAMNQDFFHQLVKAIEIIK